MFRLVSSIGMLGILLLLILQARKEETWRWFTGEDAHRAKPADAAAPEVFPAERQLGEIASGDEEFGTDRDSEERQAAAEEFLAISDTTIKIQPEEMPAYWRLFGWAQKQPLKALNKRATKEPIFNQFAQNADEQRGRLFQLDLNVRRVLSFPAPENSAGVEKLYEVWGTTEESQAWLYVVLVPELPPGMPEGPRVFERARFSGYFLKLQGYHEAGARPHAPSLSAPLFIGKLSWLPNVPVAVNPPAPTWVIWVGLTICGMIGVRLALFIWRARGGSRGAPRAFDEPTESPNVDVNTWLATASSPSRASGAEGDPSHPVWEHVSTNGSSPHSHLSSPP